MNYLQVGDGVLVNEDCDVRQCGHVEVEARLTKAVISNAVYVYSGVETVTAFVERIAQEQRRGER